ncbi:hypothetical protein OSH08_05590 [Kaistia geumhonensis]|uniref:Uncharacterized protein n=1 Tax=Kaistia geumhonensis TaxID=410839 RepID=A0ABU0M5V2_9HYPH|nr:hypothetical protein [Kaistia geumhonensis]MCX5478466.1 hypothetical protein [Kaistia geumhonensis]MDQ0516316.1 hypothetical protein [Kaistia geumhonensis]
MVKRIGIEALLRWTYRDELPKAGAARALSGVGIKRAYSAVEAYGEYLSLIDCAGENRFGVVADLMAMAEPSIDAVRVYEAVQALAGVEFELEADDGLLSDMPVIGDEMPGVLARAQNRVTIVDAQGARLIKGGPVGLIVKHALLGGCPVWEGEEPERRFRRAASGNGAAWFRTIVIETSGGPMECEVDGWDATGKRPMPGAYRKVEFDPDPAPVAEGRIEYKVWHAALGVLTDALTGALDGFDVVPTERPARPWEEAPEVAPQVLPNLTAAATWQGRLSHADRKRLAA